MKIRSKLAWTFIILLIAGITSISSYSILFIRDYLLQEGVDELQQDSRWLAVTVSNLPDNSELLTRFEEVANVSGYQVALYDSTGALISTYPHNLPAKLYMADTRQVILKARDGLSWIPDNADREKLVSYVHLPESINPAKFIEISQFKDRIYAPIETIRWIIYYGMFISIGLVIIVSIWIPRYLTKPITEIKDAALKIANGEVDRQIDLNRGDEFGTLAASLNRMADKLRWDTEQIKQYAKKQRQFFADITHEVRNPLHTISASLEMMEMRDLPEGKRKKYYTNAQNQVARITRLFKDLKTLQRYDSDEHFIEPHTFNLSVIGKHMQQWYDEKARQKGLSLIIDIHCCKVVADPGKIEQVLDNLISNAIKYTNEGTVSLSYTRKNDSAIVKVTDTGIGISEKHLIRLFDRFYRTDKARSRDKGGTGLGLAVVQSILKAHDTNIEVESEPGEGSVFWFELPTE